MDGAANVVMVARERQALGATPAANRLSRFENLDRQARACQDHRRRQTVRAGPDDHRIAR